MDDQTNTDQIQSYDKQTNFLFYYAVMAVTGNYQLQ